MGKINLFISSWTFTNVLHLPFESDLDYSDSLLADLGLVKVEFLEILAVTSFSTFLNTKFNWNKGF